MKQIFTKIRDWRKKFQKKNLNLIYFNIFIFNLKNKNVSSKIKKTREAKVQSKYKNNNKKQQSLQYIVWKRFVYFQLEMLNNNNTKTILENVRENWRTQHTNIIVLK